MLWHGKRCESSPYSEDEINELEELLREFKLGGIIMNANEMIKIISKVWCTNEDLQKLSGLGITNTSKLKRKLKEELEKDGKVLPKGLLPMSEVVKYLNIDIDY